MELTELSGPPAQRESWGFGEIPELLGRLPTRAPRAPKVLHQDRRVSKEFKATRAQLACKDHKETRGRQVQKEIKATMDQRVGEEFGAKRVLLVHEASKA